MYQETLFEPNKVQLQLKKPKFSQKAQRDEFFVPVAHLFKM
jgi:hypothetical protein